jgi:hypothetical protein
MSDFTSMWRLKIKLTALVFMFILVNANVRAQQWPFELWHDGKIILENGDTLKGLVKYDFQQDLVQYNLDDKRTEAFSARKVLYFEIFDNTVKKYRQIFALPYTNATGYRAPVFFELLEEGKMTLLAREVLEYRNYTSPYYVSSFTRQVLVNKYFFLDQKGNITEFTGNKTDLLNLMGQKSDDVEKYIKANRLKYDDKYDFARIVAYYNSI